MHEDILRFDHEWRQGDRNVAREIACHYVEQHRHELAPLLADKTLEEIVRMVEGYRDAGREEDRIVADMWLLSEYEPQQITGAIEIGGIIEAVEAHLRGERA